MRLPVSVCVVLLLVACRADAAGTKRDLCGDLGHLAATVEALAAAEPDSRIATIRGALEKMDPTFGNLSRSALADPAVLDRLLRAHVGYRDLLVDVGDDETYAVLGAAAPVAALEFRAAFRAVVADLGCDG